MLAHRLVLGAAIIGLLSCLYASPTSPQSSVDRPASAATLRIGVIDREKLLVAYYHSQFHDAKIAALQAELKKAKEKGDSDGARKIEARGEALQVLAHRQLAGEATLANVMGPLRLYFAETAKMADVALIVEAPLFRDPRVETVDVTSKLIEKLPPVSR